ncbi:MAG: hypothetical protein U5P10_00280 [Spirochaetia bacterium]|nr:hypothetical protein [Spirochaetia bacterium]
MPVAVSITPLAYQGVSLLCLTLNDLRRERRRERLVVEQREKFETLFNHIGDAIFISYKKSITSFPIKLIRQPGYPAFAASHAAACIFKYF